MRARLLADADLHPGIVNGVRGRNPDIDFLGAQGVIAEGLRDPEVLAFAAEQHRVLVSHDINTMPRHFREFTRARTSPGLILIPQLLGIGATIDELQLVWECQLDTEFQDRVLYLPL